MVQDLHLGVGLNTWDWLPVITGSIGSPKRDNERVGLQAIALLNQNCWGWGVFHLPC